MERASMIGMEYISQKEQYDKQLIEKLGLSEQKVEKIEAKEKIKILYDYRQDQYQKLADAVYYRRGWTPNGVPTPLKMKQIGMEDLEMIKMLKRKIYEDERAGFNIWGGKYTKNEKPPTTDSNYWKKWI